VTKLLELGAGLWGKMLAGLAIVGGILLAIGKLKQAGRDAERAGQAERTNELRRQAHEVDRRIDAASDADIDRLRDKWTRQ